MPTCLSPPGFITSNDDSIKVSVHSLGQSPQDPIVSGNTLTDILRGVPIKWTVKINHSTGVLTEEARTQTHTEDQKY
jgi:hypothetical protein